MRVVVMVLLLSASFGPAASAQGLITQKALSMEMAQQIVQGVVEKCRADGFSVPDPLNVMGRQGVG